MVAITCPCYWVSPSGAFILGAIAGVVCCLSVDLFEYLRIDDPVGAVSVHGVCGIWGTLSLGLFATGQYGAPGPYGADTSTTVRGLFYGGGTNQLVAQVTGSFCICGATFVCSLIMMYGLKALGVLRLSFAFEAGDDEIAEPGSRHHRAVEGTAADHQHLVVA